MYFSLSLLVVWASTGPLSVWHENPFFHTYLLTAPTVSAVPAVSALPPQRHQVAAAHAPAGTEHGDKAVVDHNNGEAVNLLESHTFVLSLGLWIRIWMGGQTFSKNEYVLRCEQRLWTEETHTCP